MSSTNFENSDPAQNSSVSRDFVPSFELTLKLIMALKSNYLRETFLVLLGKGEDKGGRYKDRFGSSYVF